jgi:hypothetical protein
MNTGDKLILILFLVSIVVFIIGSVFIIHRRKKKSSLKNISSKQIQLQAYERLILLADRIALPNLVARLNENNCTAKELQMLLTQTIKQEYEYNITQQIYVSADAWTMIKNLKEQNTYIINQIVDSLPLIATGLYLRKKILSFCSANEQGKLHEAVSKILSFEAKKIL